MHTLYPCDFAPVGAKRQVQLTHLHRPEEDPQTGVEPGWGFADLMRGLGFPSLLHP